MSSDDVVHDPDRQEFDAGALGPPPAEQPDLSDPAQRRHQAAEDTAVPGDDLTDAMDGAVSGEPPSR